MSRAKSMLCGIAIGTVVTGIATLLTTPKNGKEFRSDVIENINQARNSINDTRNKLDSMKREGIVLKDQVKERVTDLTGDGFKVLKDVTIGLKEDYKAWQHDVRPNIQAIKEELKELESSISETKKQYETPNQNTQ